MKTSKSMTNDPLCGMTVNEATALQAERWQDVLLLRRVVSAKVSVRVRWR